MQSLQITLFTILAACLYGVVHDQITARICIEYFTIGHPRIIASESPTVLGLVWGVVATWWVGLILGLPLALAARLGSWPKLPVARLLRPIAIVLFIMALGALAAGTIGHELASSGKIRLFGWVSVNVPADRQVPFITALWAHSASYGVGFVAGLGLIAWVAFKRRNLRRLAEPASIAG